MLDTGHALPDRTRAFLDRLPLADGAGRRLRRLKDGSIVGDWFGCALGSVFQPIVDPASGHVEGFEAFLRVHGGDEQRLSPWSLFAANADDERLIALDRLARTVHALNFLNAGRGDKPLFLNVHGRLLAAVGEDHGAAFRRVVDALGLAAGRIVIETPVAASRQQDLLAFVLRNYRLNGFRVAVNVESLAQWRSLGGVLSADYVKIDGERLLGELYAEQRHRTAGLDLLRGWGTLIATRLEHKVDAALLPGIRVQGFAYGHPQLSAKDSSE